MKRVQVFTKTLLSAAVVAALNSASMSVSAAESTMDIRTDVVFDSSWADGIRKQIEKEMQSLVMRLN